MPPRDFTTYSYSVNRGTSVGRRLFLLVSCQTAIALVLVLFSVHALSTVSADYHHMYNFQFKSVAAIGLAMEEAASLKPGQQSARLDNFYRRYRTEWETAAGTTVDAIQFRKDLKDAGLHDLAQEESDTLEELGKNLQSGMVEEIRRNLVTLYNLNLRYAILDNQYVTQRLRDAFLWLAIFGTAGVLLTMFLGVHVSRAVAPRIKELVAHISSFRETGKYDKILDDGRDDIAVLSNAIDLGFSAIASREHDREEFLAIAAHELKTPVTSINGYTSMLLSNPPPGPDLDRALTTIDRQAGRLSRLIDALFLTFQARPGKMRFQPRPFDMSALVERVLREIGPLLPKTVFQSRIKGNISLIGDETLLEHAIVSLFTCASTFSAEKTPLQVAFSAADHRAHLTIDFKSDRVARQDLQDLFTPFRFVEYETGNGVRAAIGLYLCREIAQLHNGQLSVERGTGQGPEFLMELPL
jgi:signal transduction histidine kinase